MPIVNTKKITSGIKLIRPILRRYKVRIFWILLFGFLAGVFGGLGVSIVIPLFAIITGQEELSPNFISDLIKNILSFLGIPLNAFFLIAIIVVLFLLKALVQFLAKYISEKTAATYEEEARKKLFDKTMKTSWPNLLKYKGGYLERVLLFEVAQGGAVINSMGTISVLIISFLVYAVIAFGISPTITISILLFGIVIFFILKPIFYRVRKLIQKMVNDEKVVSHRINESVAGAKTIKSYTADKRIIKNSGLYFEQLKTARIRVSFIRNILGQFGEPVGIIFIGALFLLTYQTPGFSIASFAVAVYLVQKMFNSVQNIQSQLNSLNELVPYLKSAHDYYKNASDNTETTSGNKNFKFEKNIEFHNVSFSYNNNNIILSDVSFDIDKNTSVGLIGPSGVGKTTIADLIMRLFKPQSGSIKIDNVNAEEFDLSDWRRNIAYVSQDIFLINDSIENNIRFFDDSIAKEKIVEATRSANIYDTIIKLKDGLKTIVGERGLKMSAGQRQRIALARALARNPKILILDEATSSLDNESERAIRASIKNLKGKTTIMTIAHRLSTVMDSDELLVLDNGKIIEKGKPEELLKDKDSHFYRMYHIRN